MPLLEIRNLKKTYVSPDGERTLIVDIPIFMIEIGEQFAIFGYSGTGKTVFLNLVAGITKPDSGSIILDGDELTLFSDSDRDRVRAEKIGYIFQAFNLLKRYTAFENILLAMMLCGKYDRDRAMDLLDQVELGDKSDYKPDQLSVFQQHKLSVARAFANNPRLILADEPTGYLDIHSSSRAADLLKNICERNNSALILVSNDMKMIGGFEKRYRYESINNAINRI